MIGFLCFIGPGECPPQRDEMCSIGGSCFWVARTEEETKECPHFSIACLFRKSRRLLVSAVMYREQTVAKIIAFPYQSCFKLHAFNHVKSSRKNNLRVSLEFPYKHKDNGRVSPFLLSKY